MRKGIYRRITARHTLARGKGLSYVCILDVCGHAVVRTGSDTLNGQKRAHCPLCTREAAKTRPAAQRRAKVIELLRVLGGGKEDVASLADRLLSAIDAKGRAA